MSLPYLRSVFVVLAVAGLCAPLVGETPQLREGVEPRRLKQPALELRPPDCRPVRFVEGCLKVDERLCSGLERQGKEFLATVKVPELEGRREDPRGPVCREYYEAACFGTCPKWTSTACSSLVGRKGLSRKALPPECRRLVTERRWAQQVPDGCLAATPQFCEGYNADPLAVEGTTGSGDGDADSCRAYYGHVCGDCGEVWCNSPAPQFPIPDTGQLLCYDETTSVVCCSDGGSAGPCGQDGEIGASLQMSLEDRFVVDRSVETEPLVVDTVTGFEWQGCAAGTSGPDCESGVRIPATWQQARDWCGELTWGGHDDWRLPDRYQHQFSVTFRDEGRKLFGGVIPASAPEWPGGQLWLSDIFEPTFAQDKKAFSGWELGGINHHPLGDLLYFRCIRHVVRPPLPEHRFVDESGEPIDDADDVMVDTLSGITWLRDAAGSATWRDAYTYCALRTAGGHDDWRLPDFFELLSRRDADPEAFRFPAGAEPTIWSSTNNVGSVYSHLSVAVGPANSKWKNSTSTAAVLCMRR